MHLLHFTNGYSNQFQGPNCTLKFQPNAFRNLHRISYEINWHHKQESKINSNICRNFQTSVARNDLVTAAKYIGAGTATMGVSGSGINRSTYD